MARHLLEQEYRARLEVCVRPGGGAAIPSAWALRSFPPGQLAAERVSASQRCAGGSALATTVATR